MSKSDSNEIIYRIHSDLKADLLFEASAKVYWKSLPIEMLEKLDRDDRQFIEHMLSDEDSSKIEKIKIVRPPGSRLLRFTDLVFSPTSQEQIFKPLVADWHVEYFEALDQKENLMKFFFISTRHCLTFLWAVVLSFRLGSLFKAAKQLFTN